MNNDMYKNLKRELDKQAEDLKSGKVSAQESVTYLKRLGILRSDGARSEKYFPKNSSQKKKVFLGGTCGNSDWREHLIELLEMDYFNPIVDNWDEKAQKEEIRQRKECDYVLYVLTPEMSGVYSVAEVVDDSNKKPDATLFCYLPESNGKKFNKDQIKSLDQLVEMISDNGAKTFQTLKEVADYLNELV